MAAFILSLLWVRCAIFVMLVSIVQSAIPHTATPLPPPTRTTPPTPSPPTTTTPMAPTATTPPPSTPPPPTITITRTTTRTEATTVEHRPEPTLNVTFGGNLTMSCSVDRHNIVVFVIDGVIEHVDNVACAAERENYNTETKEIITLTKRCFTPSTVRLDCYTVSCQVNVTHLRELQGSDMVEIITKSDVDVGSVVRKRAQISGHGTVTNFRCINEAMRKVTCAWDGAETELFYRFYRAYPSQRCGNYPETNKCEWEEMDHVTSVPFYVDLVFRTDPDNMEAHQCSLYNTKIDPLHIIKYDRVDIIETNAMNKSLSIQWKAPERGHRHYRFSAQYQVTLQTTETITGEMPYYHTKNVTKLNCRFGRLTPFTNYTITIRCIPLVRHLFDSTRLDVVGYWSDVTEVQIRTDIGTPSVTPVIRGFEIHEKTDTNNNNNNNNNRSVSVFFEQKSIDRHGPIMGMKICFTPLQTGQFNWRNQCLSGNSNNMIDNNNRQCDEFEDPGVLKKRVVTTDVSFKEDVPLFVTLTSFTEKGFNDKLKPDNIVILPQDDLKHMRNMLLNSLTVTVDTEYRKLHFDWKQPDKSVIQNSFVLFDRRPEPQWHLASNLSLNGPPAPRASIHYEHFPDRIGMSCEFKLCPQIANLSLLGSSGVVYSARTVHDDPKVVFAPKIINIVRQDNGVFVKWSIAHALTHPFGRSGDWHIRAFLITWSKQNYTEKHFINAFTNESLVKNNTLDPIQSVFIPDVGPEYITVMLQSIYNQGGKSNVVVASIQNGGWSKLWWLLVLIILVPIPVVGMVKCLKYLRNYVKVKLFPPIDIHLPLDECKSMMKPDKLANLKTCEEDSMLGYEEFTDSQI